MKQKIKKTDEIVNSIVELYNNGLSQRQIAKEIGCGATFVSHILNENGVIKKGKAFYAKKFNNEIESIIINEYNSGLTIMELAKKYNCTNSVILSIFKRNNLSFRETRDYTKKYSINEKYFDSIDNQDKAYILGLLYTDGWNISRYKIHSYGCGIALKSEDEYILHAINNLMDSDYPITHICRDEKTYSKLSITNRDVVLSLEKLGIVPAKSFKVEFPAWLNKNLMRHFIRGLLDGDGCIRNDLKSISIVGNYKLIYGLKNFLDDYLDYDCKIYPHSRSEKICYLHIHPINKKIMFLDWIYNNANLKLDRKYNI